MLINHLPLAAAAYPALDGAGRGHDGVVVRAQYALRPREDAAAGLTWLVPEREPDGDPAPLLHEDVLSGGSVIAEADLAPFKPRCDVILSGRAHAPQGLAGPSWLARLRVSGPGDTEPLLDKTLRVHAPRRFFSPDLGLSWTLREGPPVTQVDLAWELAYGGASVVRNQRHEDNPVEPEHLLDEVNLCNPLGKGWWHARLFEQLARAGLPRPAELPAPQWEYPSEPITQPDFTDTPPRLTVPRMQAAAAAYAHRPAGFGAVGRAWTPRIQLAGTYGDTWARWSHPQLPRDFDMGYWCCAPADQQVAYLPPGTLVELANLVDPALCPSGHAVIRMPAFAPRATFTTTSGLPVQARLVLDTVHIDTHALTLALTWRASLLATSGTRCIVLDSVAQPHHG